MRSNLFFLKHEISFDVKPFSWNIYHRQIEDRHYILVEPLNPELSLKTVHSNGQKVLLNCFFEQTIYTLYRQGRIPDYEQVDSPFPIEFYIKNSNNISRLYFETKAKSPYEPSFGFSSVVEFCNFKENSLSELDKKNLELFIF